MQVIYATIDSYTFDLLGRWNVSLMNEALPNNTDTGYDTDNTPRHGKVKQTCILVTTKEIIDKIRKD